MALAEPCGKELGQIVACGGAADCVEQVERDYTWCILARICPGEAEALRRCMRDDGSWKLDKSPTWRCKLAFRAFDKCLTNYDPLQ